MKLIHRIIPITLTILCLVSPSAVSTGSQSELVIVGDYVFPDLRRIVEQGISFYMEETGRRARFQYAPRLDEAILRAVVLGDPADVLIVPRADLQRYVLANMLHPLEPLIRDGEIATLEELVPTEVFVWGRIDDTLYCAYIPSRSPTTRFGRYQPAYLCVSKGSRDPAAAWELVKHVALVSGTADSDADMIDNFMFKLLTERDVQTIYRRVIHPDRKQDVTGDPADWTEDRFIRHMDSFYFSIDPIFSARSLGQQSPPSSAPRRLTYVGDPTGRKQYSSHEMSQFLYEIRTGIEYKPKPGRYLTNEGMVIVLPSQVRGGNLGPNTQITITVHKQDAGVHPRRYVFHSPEYRFEAFWTEGL